MELAEQKIITLIIASVKCWFRKVLGFFGGGFEEENGTLGIVSKKIESDVFVGNHKAVIEDPSRNVCSWDVTPTES